MVTPVLSEFENTTICRSVAQYIKFLVNKRKALQFEQQVINQKIFDFGQRRDTYYVNASDDIFQMKASKRKNIITRLLSEVEEELKSYDHRNNGGDAGAPRHLRR
jgi:hypothetical protein